MPLREHLLEILCCPRTGVRVRMLSREEILTINDHISRGSVKFVDGSQVKGALAEGLITEDGKTIYKIDDGIPIMLVDQGIPAQQIEGLSVPGQGK